MQWTFDRVINDLVVLDPIKRGELAYAQIVHLAERFPPPVDQEVIKEEFEDYQLMKDTEIGKEEGGV